MFVAVIGNDIIYAEFRVEYFKCNTPRWCLWGVDLEILYTGTIYANNYLSAVYNHIWPQRCEHVVIVWSPLPILLPIVIPYVCNKENITNMAKRYQCRVFKEINFFFWMSKKILLNQKVGFICQIIKK